MKKWELLDSREIFSDKWATLKNNSYRNSKGVIINNYTKILLRDYSVIFPVTREGKVVMVRQYKSGVDEIFLELPMGFIEEGESPVECAARELKEETGYTTEDKLESLGAYYNSPGKVRQRFHVFLARNLVRNAGQSLDKNEDLEVELVDLQKIDEMIKSGEHVTGACSALGIALALKRLGV